MATDTFESLTGTWVEVDPERKDLPSWSREFPLELYKLVIDGDKITITKGTHVICDTIFRLDGTGLQNTKKRENWQAYVEMRQHEYFGHFEMIKIIDEGLAGFLFVADMGYIKFPFVKCPEKHPA